MEERLREEWERKHNFVYGDMARIIAPFWNNQKVRVVDQKRHDTGYGYSEYYVVAFSDGKTREFGREDLEKI